MFRCLWGYSGDVSNIVTYLCYLPFSLKGEIILLQRKMVVSAIETGLSSGGSKKDEL